MPPPGSLTPDVRCAMRCLSLSPKLPSVPKTLRFDPFVRVEKSLKPTSSERRDCWYTGAQQRAFLTSERERRRACGLDAEGSLVTSREDAMRGEDWDAVPEDDDDSPDLHATSMLVSRVPNVSPTADYRCHADIIHETSLAKASLSEALSKLLFLVWG